MKFIKKNKFTLMKTMVSLMSIFMFFSAIVTPFYLVNAACTDSNVAGTDNKVADTGCDDITIDVKIDNPLSSNIGDIPSFIEALLNIALVIGVPIVALGIIYTGFLFVTAQGNAEKLGTAKKALTYTLIGGALLLGSWVIANALKGTIDEIKRTT